MKLIFDLETDGFLHKMTQVHCLVIKDRDTGEKFSYADQEGYPSLEEGIRKLAEADILYAHNGIRFDYRVLDKFYPHIPITGKRLDTQVLAEARFIHIKSKDYKMAKLGKFPGHLCASHSLAAWGHRLGVWKGDYEGGWEEWNEEMQRYCEQDVEVTSALLDVIAKAGVTKETVELEHDLKWYLAGQEDNGWPFDMEAARQLETKLRARLEELSWKLVGHFGEWYEASGKPKFPKQDRTMRKGKPAPEHYKEGCAYTRIKSVEFNPRSRQHIEKVLREHYGWQPKEFTPSGQAKIDETTLDGMEYPEAEMLQEYLTITKRLGQLVDGQQGWIDKAVINPITGMHHIHHACIPGPITHRMRHLSPNLGQVPAVYSAYGPECRSLFVVPEGWKMVGADVAGLELRVMGHHMFPYDGGKYAEDALDPEINNHQINADALGCSRDDAKTWFYAYIYGAGNKKLGSIVMPGGTPDKKLKARGKQDRGKFERALEALAAVVDGAKAEFQRGYLKLLDGRPAYPRGEHSAFNTKVQGDGAIICKKWVAEVGKDLTERFGPQGWNGQWAGLGFIHDELQVACHEDISEEVGQIMVDLIPEVGKHLGLKVALTGDYKVGDTWAETH